MKPLHRDMFLFVLVVSFAFIVSAQDGNQSPGDLARQEREQRQEQFRKSGQAPSKQRNEQAVESEIAGLKEGHFQANILITDSNTAIEKWVLLPAADRPRAGRFREVTPGKIIYVPVVITNYTAQTSEKMNLTAHIRISSPEGKTIFDEPRFSWAIQPDPRSPRTIVLNPVLDIVFHPNDLPGRYTICATITDHVHSTYAKAEEKVQLIQDKTDSREMGKNQ